MLQSGFLALIKGTAEDFVGNGQGITLLGIGLMMLVEDQIDFGCFNDSYSLEVGVHKVL